jgi:AraC-like DNA-binding protein
MSKPAEAAEQLAGASGNERVDGWRDQVRTVCGESLEVMVDRDAFANGAILTSAIGGFRVSLISADPHSVYLSGKRATDADGHVYVTAPLSGTIEVTQDGGHAVVGAGDVVTFDSTRSYALEVPERFQMVAVRFPHQLIGLTPGATAKLTAEPWAGDEGVGALVSQTLGTLGKQVNDWDLAVTEPLSTAISGLISTLFTDRLRDEGGEDPLAARQALMLRVQSYAREHISDPDLRPVVLARKHNVSLRYLQVVFSMQGTSPAKWIRDERLSGILNDLSNPRNDHLTVAIIGERWGLLDASQVSRLFRQRYGVTPRDYRQLRQRGEDVPIS